MSQDPAPADQHDRIAPGFARRLSYYVFGIAIGLLMLGLINQARSRARSTPPGAQSPPADAPVETPQTP